MAGSAKRPCTGSRVSRPPRLARETVAPEPQSLGYRERAALSTRCDVARRRVPFKASEPTTVMAITNNIVWWLPTCRGDPLWSPTIGQAQGAAPTRCVQSPDLTCRHLALYIVVGPCRVPCVPHSAGQPPGSHRFFTDSAAGRLADREPLAGPPKKPGTRGDVNPEEPR